MIRPRSLVALGFGAALAVTAGLLIASRTDPRPEVSDEPPSSAAPVSRPPPAATLEASAHRGDGPQRGKGGGRIVGGVRREGRPSAARIEVRRLPAPEGDGDANVPPGSHFAWRVKFRYSVAPIVARATAGEDGTFLVAGVPPGTYGVVADTEDGAAASARTEVREGGVAVVALDVAVGSESLARHCCSLSKPPSGQRCSRSTSPEL